MTKYTRIISEIVTKYIPIIALFSSLYGVARICSIVVVSIAILPYMILGMATLIPKTKIKIKIITIILYIETILILTIKH